MIAVLDRICDRHRTVVERGPKREKWWDVCNALVTLVDYEITKLSKVNRDHLNRLSDCDVRY
jgi:hypothetical protein